MKYNNGTVQHINNNTPQEQLQEMAKEFSEGNQLLEELLLKMWRCGIKMMATTKTIYMC